MTAANVRQVERKMLRPPDTTNIPTTLVFPKEVPTTTDWLEWAGFWLTNLEPGLTLTNHTGYGSSSIWRMRTLLSTSATTMPDYFLEKELHLQQDPERHNTTAQQS